MLIRRCAMLYFEAREDVEFDLALLVAGGTGLARTQRCLALAPHLEQPVEIDATAQAWLAQLSPVEWTEVEDGSDTAAQAAPLLQEGLIFRHDAPVTSHAVREASLRESYWHPLAAVMHAFSRWEGVDAVRNMQESQTETAAQMRQTLGPPPAEASTRWAQDGRELPLVQDDGFDELLASRVTCRNFDGSRAVPLELFAKTLQRTFGATGAYRVGEDLVFLKKNVPSGGGLHPTEAYLVVQNVEGLDPGLYHYRGDQHRIDPVAGPVTLNRDWVMDMLGQQHWFADAHVLVVLASRFDRTFWKYRRHAKSYRVVTLEAGHLSQTLYLSATKVGMGAFITAAINEKAIERAFSLDPVTDGVLAVCGFGWRAVTMTTTELDPAGVIWNLEDRAG
ncbi:putative peptide maturation dehydrogenase [Stenotrophomonas sp. CC120222-04]|uniref:putative peptide maturation dehydrogenase n=1 Tax=Stenotrophomonas sp. CC120222-04 TaxID=1378088 RepID=UPI000B67D548|nr:putative peptide maturation dehydrogenase [Stenotrophomonas sp. CC120222-04]SNT83744.1 putative peptide maturation dehydrogenase [Stenotrophomonas sp. CC120222-04]